MKSRAVKLSTFLMIVLSLLACQQATETDVLDQSSVLAKVGDFSITEDYLAAFQSSQGIRPATEQQQLQSLDDLVKLVSLAQQAQKDGLQLNQQQSFVINQTRNRALAQLAIEKHLAANPVSATDIQAEYARITSEIKGEEYHVRHLLYKDELNAIQVLDQITAGLTYSEIEQAYLEANPQVKNVGNIGWVNLMQVPEAFSAPLQSMEVESVYDKPLVSQFGVHVLYLEDKRPLVAPAFETVEAGIRKTLEQRKIERYRQLAVIKAKAQIVAK